MSQNKNKLVHFSIITAFILILSGIAMTLWVHYAYLFPNAPAPYTDIAQIGDFIGGVSAPFLAIAGSLLVFAAFQKQANDSEKSAQDLIRQEFENTFLQMIQLLREIRKEVNLTKSGTDYFNEIITQFQQEAKNGQETLKHYFNTQFYPNDRNKTEHYVAFILHIIDYIHTHHTDPHKQQNAKDKVKLLSLQFTHDELLYIHTHIQLKNPEKTPLFEQYEFFQRLPQSDRLIP